MRKKEIKRKRTTPGEILRKEYLIPLKITQKKLADHIGVDIKVINRLVNGKTSVSPELALKLAASFNTTPQFWLNAQLAVDLERARRREKKLSSLVSEGKNYQRFRLLKGTYKSKLDLKELRENR